MDPLAQRPAAAANAPAASLGAASPLQLPQLNSLAPPASSGPADGAAATSWRLPKQKRDLFFEAVVCLAYAVYSDGVGDSWLAPLVFFICLYLYLLSVQP